MSRLVLKPTMTKVSVKLYFLLQVYQIVYIALATDPPPFYYHRCSSGNYTNGSSYQSNLRSLLNSISVNTNITYGFYNFSSGQGGADSVHAIALCTGYTTTDQCRSCILNATSRITVDCPTQKQASGWYLECFIRYSNESIFGVLDDNWLHAHYNTQNDLNPSGFNASLQLLLNGLKNQAASGNSLRKYADGNVTFGFSTTVYGISQCTPDLTTSQCTSCLNRLASWIPSCCNDKVGARILCDSCFLRYEEYKFYTDPTPSSPSSPASPSLPSSPSSPSSPSIIALPHRGKKHKTSLLIAVILSVSLAVVIGVILICYHVRKRRKAPTVYEAVEFGNEEIAQVNLNSIRLATNDFSEEYKLGSGGFGSVYKCTLSDGLELAAKRLSINSEQGDSEFLNEALLLVKLRHRNLIRLVGLCLEKNERILVYEYAPNTSLDRFLFDPEKRALLTWELRWKIIEGIARGLQYLHEDSRLKIIHRDLKASNVLLDDNMNPKIADFGMARLFAIDQTGGDTNRIVGTYGYMAPEYALYGHFSEKSDVFSFGVLVLEIISGQRNSYQLSDGKDLNLLTHVWKRWREGKWREAVDPYISNAAGQEIVRCIHVALLCVHENEANRPTITSIIAMLSSESSALPAVSQPAFVVGKADEIKALDSLNKFSVSLPSPR